MTALARVDDLEELAGRIHRAYKRSRESLADAVDGYFEAGACLLEARRQLRDDQSFGAWREAQNFGFSQQWAHILRQAAEHESEVRPAVTTQVVTGGSLNFKKVVQQVVAANGNGRRARTALAELDLHLAPTAYATVVVDPPWPYDNAATRGAATDHYPTMSLDELAALEVPAADRAHLYLWVTNSFLRAGFDLLDRWEFTYKTCLTWCKPSIGMGNYFRNNTEHVLFAVRGALGTLANNEPTWFTAGRGPHSAKPEAFYDIVERSSPGPRLEMFARQRRLGWHAWGNEA